MTFVLPLVLISIVYLTRFNLIPGVDADDSRHLWEKLLHVLDYPAYIKTLLAFGAGADTVVSTRSAARFVAHMKAGRMVMLPEARHEILQARPAVTGEWPDLHPNLIKAMKTLGVESLYADQSSAIELAQSLHHVLYVSSSLNKSVCYNLSTLDAILKDDSARALYLFPTPALAENRLSELIKIVEATEKTIGTFAYDMTTNSADWAKIRQDGRIVISNMETLCTL